MPRTACAPRESLGLEWFVMGLSPWSNPTVVQIPFQLGMLTFWSTVACAPRIVLDQRTLVSGVRKAYLQFLVLGFLLIYLVAFTVPDEVRFVSVIAAVLLNFVLLNLFYIRYLQRLKRS